METKPSCSSAWQMRCTVVRGSPTSAASWVALIPSCAPARCLRMAAALASTCTPLRSLTSCSPAIVTVPPSRRPQHGRAATVDWKTSEPGAARDVPPRPDTLCRLRPAPWWEPARSPPLHPRAAALQVQTAPDREEVQVPVLVDPAPDAARCLGGHQHGQYAESQQVPGPVLTQRLQQREVDDRTDDGALDAAEPADDDDEDGVGRPVDDAEGRRRLDAQQVEGHDRTDDAAAEGSDDVHDQLGAEHVHARALRRQVVVADGVSARPAWTSAGRTRPGWRPRPAPSAIQYMPPIAVGGDRQIGGRHARSCRSRRRSTGCWRRSAS